MSRHTLARSIRSRAGSRTTRSRSSMFARLHPARHDSGGRSSLRKSNRQASRMYARRAGLRGL